jgi:hypothetical protein
MPGALIRRDLNPQGVRNSSSQISSRLDVKTTGRSGV